MEAEAASGGVGAADCACAGADTGATLQVLKDVQRAYEQRMDLLEQVPKRKRQQLQMELLRSWVSDLGAQNALLARAVQQLEGAAAATLLRAQRTHSEVECELRAELAVLRRRLVRKDSDLRGLLEVLRRLRDLDYCGLDGIHFFEKGKRNFCGKINEINNLNESLRLENVAKDREIRKLLKDAQQYEQTIMHLRSEISLTKYHTPDVTTKNAKVMAQMCCTGAECGDWEPVKDFNSNLREEMMNYQERIQKLENHLKSSGEDVRAVRKVNVSLREEIHSLRGVCAALSEQCRAAVLRGQFKDEIIREMRRQLKHAKSKVFTCFPVTSKRVKTSTPNSSRDLVLVDCGHSPDVSTIFVDCSQGSDDAIAYVDSGQGTENLIPADQAPILITHQPNDSIETGNLFLVAESTSTADLTDQTNVTSPKCKQVQELTRDQLNKVKELKRKPGLSQLCKKGTVRFMEQDEQNQSRSSKISFEDQVQCEPCEFNPGGQKSCLLKRKKVCDPCERQPATECTTKAPLNADCVCALEESRSSAVESPSSSCASARAHYYQNKLLATLQILQNKEDTVRVQAESLAVAEARISALTTRNADLKKEIERKGREIQTLCKTLQEYRAEKADVSITAEIKGMDNQENVVTTLQNNLGVIEELYRECFYETIKQDNLIEMLRDSYLDVRLMDKEKSEKISKLHNVINTQKWSLDRCQDIATEVDNLKLEISSFINSSSNDSGMWEESIVGGLNEDLQDIAAQLLRLRDLLTGDCTCGLEEENMQLKLKNCTMEAEISALRTEISDLEANLKNKDILEQRSLEEIEVKERELDSIRSQLRTLEQNSKEKSTCCDLMTTKLSQAQDLLEEKTLELHNAQKQCEVYEEKIRKMKEELSKMEEISKENASLRGAARAATCRASRLQRRATELHEELTRATAHADHVEARYRQQAASAAEVERQLGSAHARGAELCREAGRAARAGRAWAARARARYREQEEQIKEKEAKIQILQDRLEKMKVPRVTMCPSQWDQCCSPCPSGHTISIRERQLHERTTSTKKMEEPCSCAVIRNEGTFVRPSVCVRERQQNEACTSASEIATCSSTPVPPKRTLKKIPPATYCGIRRRYGMWGPFDAVQRDASAQHPARCDGATRCDATRDLMRDFDRCPTASRATDEQIDLSPGHELYSRLESLSAALADGYRRWSRRAS